MKFRDRFLQLYDFGLAYCHWTFLVYVTGPVYNLQIICLDGSGSRVSDSKLKNTGSGITQGNNFLNTDIHTGVHTKGSK